MGDSNDRTETNSDSAQAVQEVRKSAPWTKQLRQVALIVLGSAAFAVFLYMMFLKTQGSQIPYEDVFIVLGVSGTLLGVNFGLDLLTGLASERINAGIGNGSSDDTGDRRE